MGVGRSRGRRSVLGSVLAVTLVATTLAVNSSAQASVGGVVAINEMVTVPPVTDGEFLELRNLTGSPVDASGWCFTDGIALCLPVGATVPANGFLLVVENETVARAQWGIPAATPVYQYTGGLRGSGETVRLEDGVGGVVDEVTYGSVAPWPTGPAAGSGSLERINPAVVSSSPFNWAESNPAPTPLAENTAYDPTTVPFTVLSAVATPFRPNPAQAIVVTAETTEPATTSIDLTYVVDFGTPVTIPMTNTTGNFYEATIPGQGAGDLVRYRVDAATAFETSGLPVVGDSKTYEGVVVLDPAVSSAVPILEWFMDDAVYDDLLANHRFDDVYGPAVMTYDGVVYDGTQMRVRGDSCREDPKVCWKVEMPAGYLFDMPGMLHEPVDEFNLQADQWPLAGQGWMAVSEARNPEVDYVFVRQQRNGAFHGVGAYVEAMDGRWRNRNKYDDDSYYKVVDSHLRPWASETAAENDPGLEKKEGDPTDFTDIFDLANALDQPAGQAELDWIYDNVDIASIINYTALITLLRHPDAEYQNYRITRDGNTQRWDMLPWDLDRIFRPAGGLTGGLPDTLPLAEYLDNAMFESFFDHPELEQLFYRRLKTLRDEIFGDNSIHDYYADTVNSMLADYALEDALWGHSGTTSSKIEANEERIQLVRDLVDAETDPLGTAKVPQPQPANPQIVINEIQWDPLSGTEGEWIELYNRHDTPVDISGWSFDTGIEEVFRGGTVIPANGYMISTKHNPTYLANNPSGRYVGADHAKGMSNAGETIRLLNQNGAVVDSVTYGGAAPWPVIGDGPSIERRDPRGPSNDPTNWARSDGTGTPGLINSKANPLIRPFGTVVLEGDTGTTTADAVVYLEDLNGDPYVATEPVTVDWFTFDTAHPNVAKSGVDFVPAAGTLTIPIGASQGTVPVDIIGDTLAEPPLLFGEWGLLAFGNPSPNARINTVFFGLGVIIIIDDD